MVANSSSIFQRVLFAELGKINGLWEKINKFLRTNYENG